MKLDMVGIIVSDMAESLLFYERLGFTVTFNQENNYVELNNQGVRISLNSKKMISGIYGFEPTAEGDKLELAFLCESVAEVNQVAETMAEFGYEIFKEPWDAFWGQRYAIIKDPNGNLLSLFANLPGVSE